MSHHNHIKDTCYNLTFKDNGSMDYIIYFHLV